MSIINVQAESNSLIITDRIAFPETVDYRESHLISSGAIAGLLPFTITHLSGETMITVEAEGMVPASRYFGNSVSKASFLDFVAQVASVVKRCEVGTLSADRLDLQLARIFINPVSGKVHCIYWPITNFEFSASPWQFFTELPSSFSFQPYEDTSFLQKYYEFFNSAESFSAGAFERMVSSLKPGGPSAPARQAEMPGAAPMPQGNHPGAAPGLQGNNSGAAPVPQEKDPVPAGKKRGFISGLFRRASSPEEPVDNGLPEPVSFEPKPSPAGDEAFIRCPSCGENNEADSLFCGYCGTKLAAPSAPNPVALPKNEQKYAAPQQNEPPFCDDGTVALNRRVPGQAPQPFLIRGSTGERYAVNKPMFRIGKDRTANDLVITDNKFISRRHAYIITKQGRYFIVDNNSTNKTCINGAAIQPGTEVEIKSGVVLRFADEYFSFKI